MSLEGGVKEVSQFAGLHKTMKRLLCLRRLIGPEHLVSMLCRNWFYAVSCFGEADLVQLSAHAHQLLCHTQDCRLEWLEIDLRQYQLPFAHGSASTAAKA